ncbi:MAG: cupin domain-containing protein [Acidobacteriota bacterium]
MKLTRRDLSLLLPVLAAAPVAAQDKKAPPAVQKMTASKLFQYEDLPVKQNGQNKGRAVFDGETHLDFPVELHITELGPGQAPHPPHQHSHEEVVLMRRGLLDVTILGKTTRLTAGSVVYVGSGELHGWKNPGSERSEYFVIALGKGRG